MSPLALTKRDFLKNFYPAYERAFTEDNIKSGWHKTGLEPFDPEQVLKIFKKEEPEEEDALSDRAPSDSRSSCCLHSPSAMRTIRRIVSEEVVHSDAKSQRLVDKLGNTCLTFATELILAREREQGYTETISTQKKKRKRGRPFTADLRAEKGLGALFFSPSEIKRAKELQTSKDEAKELESHNKLLRAQDRAAQKAQKEAEAQQRREDRAARAAARKTEEALEKAQKQQQKEAKETQKQLETKSKASTSRPRKKQKTRKESKKPGIAAIESEPRVASNFLKSRSGRTIKKPAHLDDI